MIAKKLILSVMFLGMLVGAELHAWPTKAQLQQKAAAVKAAVKNKIQAFTAAHPHIAGVGRATKNASLYIAKNFPNETAVAVVGAGFAYFAPPRNMTLEAALDWIYAMNKAGLFRALFLTLHEGPYM